MPIQVLDRSVGGIVDSLESGNFVSFDGDQQVLRYMLMKVPGNVIQLTNVLGRQYLPFDTTFADVRLFTATGSCNVSLSVNGTTDYLLNNVSVTTTSQTVNLSDRVVNENNFLQLDVVSASSATDLTLLVRTVMPFESLLIQA